MNGPHLEARCPRCHRHFKFLQQQHRTRPCEEQNQVQLAYHYDAAQVRRFASHPSQDREGVGGGPLDRLTRRA